MAPDDKTGGNNGTVGIIAIFQLRGAVAVRFYRWLRRYLDLSPDGLLLPHFVGMTPNMPYNVNSVPPFGVPQFISLSFWGGVRGIIFVLVEPYLVRSPGGYWVGAINLGAIFPRGSAHASWIDGLVAGFKRVQTEPRKSRHRQRGDL